MKKKVQSSLKDVVGEEVYSVWTAMLHKIVPDGGSCYYHISKFAWVFLVPDMQRENICYRIYLRIKKRRGIKGSYH